MGDDFADYMDDQIATKDAEIGRLRECCEKYGKKVMRQEANMLKVIARNREQRKQLSTKEVELVRWQEIAIDLKASAIQDTNSGDFVNAKGDHMFQVVDIEKCREQAAKELGLQVKQEAGYLERLERLALSLCMEAGWGQEDFEAALEKIRRG